MDADEFRDYILGFIFYKYLSEKMHRYANRILVEDGVEYLDVEEGTDGGDAMLEAVREESVEQLGYFLKPSELFSEIAKRGNSKGRDGASSFILDDLQTILTSIEQSTLGTDSEDDFDKLFEDLDLTSTKLGRTEAAKNELIAKVLVHLDGIDFQLDKTDSDVLGDAYEYLIGQFASGAGKKAGEFYTPKEVSTILARIVTTGKNRLKSIYDPTCGSGSLLLRVAREVEEVGHYYGQEMNRTTYNLARMNMLLHDIHYSRFDLRQEDTLIRQYLIKEKNWLDAVIGLPANIFYGTTIPTCILVFKKCREHPQDVLFIDASGLNNFEKRKNQNYLRERDIERIVDTYRERTEAEKFSHRARLAEIAENDFNLNIPRYVDTFEEEELVDLDGVRAELKAIAGEMAGVDAAITDFCKELGLEAPA